MHPLFYVLNGTIFDALYSLKENIFILSLVEYKKDHKTIKIFNL